MPRMHPFFLPVGEGNRFCLLHSPDEEPRGALVYIHPFAEEMNKCRRMAALQSRSFARAGWSVLQIDLLGCGDSSGDFGDASWQAWLDDTIGAASWLQRETGKAPAFWGLRAGCLLAAQAADATRAAAGLVLWQPTLSGSRHLQQFLRLKIASGIAGQRDADSVGPQALRQKLAGGESVEVLGYTLNPGLAMGLDSAELMPPRQTCNVAWLEIGSGAGSELPPASATCVQKWTAAGHAVDARVVPGDAFWQTAEVTECPDLIQSTTAALESW